MSQNDEFNLRELIGEGDADVKMPGIEDTPASELPLPSVPKPETNNYSPRVEKVGPPVPPETVKLSHPVPLVPMGELPETPSTIAPMIQDADIQPTVDEKGKPTETREDVDAEYYDTFNATVAEVKDLEPEALQAVMHRLDRMIRRAKIQKTAVRVTYGGKIEFVDAKRLKNLKDKDAEFMSRRKVVDGEAKPKAPKSPKADTGLTTAEKQVKQFVKLSMDEATIRKTLSDIGTAIPTNLTELIAKFKK